MKIKLALGRRRFWAGLLASLAVGMAARGAEPTALQLAKEGDRYVGDQAKGRIVQIRSERSAGSLVPVIWYVVYYDPTATLKAAEVKFVAGKMEDVKRPLRLLEPVTGGDVPLDRDKIKVDSDQAIQTALKEPVLQNIKVTSTELKLERGEGEGVLGKGGAAQPVWKVRLWATKLNQVGSQADLGEVWVSATDGKVLKDDLHVDRLQ